MSNKFSISSVLVGIVLGASITGGAYLSLSPSNSSEQMSSDDSKPLYWVAPMDPNYKRDKPGKSPMGMDLIPVYKEDNSGSDAGPGAVKISPEVINNLGVRTDVVKKQKLHSEIKTVGYIQYDQDQLIHIHPRVQGWIEKLFVKAEGDPVKKGQPLYEIYSPALVNAQEELLLALDRNNQRLIRAAKERLKALQLPEQSVANLISTRKVSQTITFYSPQTGVVDNLKVRQGFFVKPGTTLMSVGGLDQVWVEAEIFERQLPFVNLNDPVSMKLDYIPGEKWHGKVDYIYPTLNSKTRTAKVRLKFENRDNILKPNMFAQIAIHSDAKTNRVVVPRESVIRTGNQDRVVLALEDGRFKSVEVKLGLQDRDYIEVLEGVFENEKIVVSAQFLIDSESSKSSDFKRMQSVDEQPASAWVSAKINSSMPNHRMVNATHEAIEDWGWPEMTMDFTVADSVDIDSLTQGLSLHVEITRKSDSEYVISNIHIMDSHGDGDSGSGDMNELEEINWAEVDGIINSIDHNTRVINISRGPIEKWNRPAATLDFVLSEEIDIHQLKEKESIRFRFEIHDDFIIVSLLDGQNEEQTLDHSNH